MSPWSHLLPSEAGQSVLAMTLDSRGEPAVTGSLFERIDPYAMPLSGKHKGVFLTRMSDTGSELWSTMARGDITLGHSVASAPNGDVLLLGSFAHALTLGGQDMTAAEELPYRETFLARFNPRGELLWTRPLSNGVAADSIAAISLVTNAGGDAIIAGNSGVVASFDADGNLLWTHPISGMAGQLIGVSTVSVDASGAIFLAGNSQRDSGEPTQVPLLGGFVTKLSPDGQRLFTVEINGDVVWGSVKVTAMATSPTGEVVFSGEFVQPIHFGSMTFQATEPTQFVAGISATGEPAWLDAVQAPYGKVKINALAIAPNGRIYATGQYEGDELSVGGLVFGPTSGTAMFLVELDGRGKATDGRIFDHAGKLSAGRALAVDPEGALLLAGHFIGQIDLDDQTLTSMPLGSSFVARLALPFASHRRE